MNNPEFFFDSFADRRVGPCAIAVSVDESLFAEAAQFGLVGLTDGDGENRQVMGIGIEADVAAFGDFQRIFQRFGDGAEYSFHLFRRTQVI